MEDVMNTGRAHRVRYNCEKSVSVKIPHHFEICIRPSEATRRINWTDMYRNFSFAQFNIATFPTYVTNTCFQNIIKNTVTAKSVRQVCSRTYRWIQSVVAWICDGKRGIVDPLLAEASTYFFSHCWDGRWNSSTLLFREYRGLQSARGVKLKSHLY